ncbi:uncharacterized protein PITG_20411 [Phytophthora infestans T30-4]|uniref:Uncharacterized protein n=1 Tax=Phytophthora infestans (strain T30-4) TaxID=403677 RepID=D0P225_PHYIT|nr:uncharacterized protein PITG_20411 [Phytophthora infestans T30-4]EEY55448.1 hypothetical protein PITG_20411 [Phytophthora infestans T30-4]|eukprot:XP_002895642.1 hypothetical protein PITG_20411 [Phytophthora infestans T30-4]
MSPQISSTEADGGSVVDGEIAADETVTASQINTSIMLSASTIEDMFDSSSESDIEETAAPVNDKADASRVSVGDDGSDTADDIPSVDGEGGLSVEDRESAEDDDRFVVAASDVNVLAADELYEGYESVGSDGVLHSISRRASMFIASRAKWPPKVWIKAASIPTATSSESSALLGYSLRVIASSPLLLLSSLPSSEVASGRSEYPGLSCDVASPVHLTHREDVPEALTPEQHVGPTCSVPMVGSQIRLPQLLTVRASHRGEASPTEDVGMMVLAQEPEGEAAPKDDTKVLLALEASPTPPQE